MVGPFDGLLGGIVGGAMASVVNGVLEQRGGVQGMVNQFEKNGFGATPPCSRGWAPAPTPRFHRMTCIEPSDRIDLQQLAATTGMSVPELTQKPGAGSVVGAGCAALDSA
jgi:hypothetical protein